MKEKKHIARIFLLVLILLNLAVLLGQVWPQGAPPFARAINIIFLCLSLLYFLFSSKRKDN